MPTAFGARVRKRPSHVKADIAGVRRRCNKRRRRDGGWPALVRSV